MRTCLLCGKELKSGLSWAKWCSKECRMTAYWKRKSEAIQNEALKAANQVFKKAVIIVLLLSANAFAYSNSEICDAIYKAEGGINAKKPFGILSVKCSGYEDCRNICLNTVRNNVKRWQKTDLSKDFLSFLARAYAPIGASNDPSGLNRNWLKNVTYFLTKK